MKGIFILWLPNVTACYFLSIVQPPTVLHGVDYVLRALGTYWLDLLRHVVLIVRSSILPNLGFLPRESSPRQVTLFGGA